MLSSSGGVAKNGEDSAFDRFANSLERDLDSFGECGVDGFGVHLGCVDRALTQTTQDLRGDNARIAARTHESTRGDSLPGCVARGADRQSCKVLDNGLNGKGHVRARVSIRHGEHVQAVDLLFAAGKDLACRSDRVEDVIR